ncbi:MAG TPA: glycosyltransferase [Pyrinomonadaceae bacterium]|jgi:glycosyltransferase involved in cell wall biosynthesis|nr:glycosyltransferase [Pyrinomonadaceae bacterium]
MEKPVEPYDHENRLRETPDELSRLRAEHQRLTQGYSQLRLELEDIKTSFGFKLLQRILWPLGRAIVPGPLRSQIKRAVLGLKGAPVNQAETGGEAEELIWKVDADLSVPFTVGLGNLFYLSGNCYHSRQRIKRLSVIVDGEPHRVINHSLAESEAFTEKSTEVDAVGNSFASRFWTALPFPQINAPREVKLSLRALLDDGSEREAALGPLRLQPREQTEERAEDFDESNVDEPRVVICMATYNPPLELFARQIESIVGQTFRNWVCVINDDCSDPSIFSEIRRIISQDARFRLHRNAARLGYYRNFELCLKLAPASAEFMAFSDQDDYWYSDKLAACLAEFQAEDVQLVYSDMDIAAQDGRVVSHTYWTTRRNNYTDLETLLLANTVTGASVVFRASLLDALLPFPRMDGVDLYHDHWAACVALTRGRIGYVDRPLYAYQQHSGNVIGHTNAAPARFLPQLRSIARALSLFMGRSNGFGQQFLQDYSALYRVVPVRIAFIAGVLRLRFKDATAERRVVLERFERLEYSLPVMIVEAVKYKLKRRPTLGVEWLCLSSTIIVRLFKNYYRRNRRRLAASKLAQVSQVPRLAQPSLPDASEAVEFIPQKLAPIKLDISEESERRVNILISEINFKYMFAGYLSMLNLALKLGRSGYRVRLVIVDPCDYDPARWSRLIADYDGLRDVFGEVQTAYVYDRSVPLKVNPRDAFIATSWWTAHIAHHASKSLGQERFSYLIQDYEPLFYPSGSLYALAEQAYSFPHHAVFSTSMLRDYFRQHSIGVYSGQQREHEAPGPIVIQNAVCSFEIDEKELRRRRRRRLIFYARPEQKYFARNMFELGTLALRAALGEGHFDARKWEFHGIGTVDNYRSVPLSADAELRMLPRLGLQEYRRVLPGYDLGLSLMLSPHPSITPLDMAAAGLVTVTNTYATKTAEKMAEISTNIIAVSPTIDGVKLGLVRALGEVDDTVKRLNGARLNWCRSWDATFDADIIAALGRFIGW